MKRTFTWQALLQTAILIAALTGCQSEKRNTHQVGDYTVSVSVNPDPPRVGPNTLSIAIRDPDDHPVAGGIVHIHYSMPAMAGMPAMGSEVQANETSAGRYEGDVDFSAGGKFPWNIRLEIANNHGIVATSLWKVIPETKGVQFVSAQAAEEPGADAVVDYYTCTMHPSVKLKNSGKCPICAMDLVPVYKSQERRADTTQVDYYTCTMHPSVKQKDPGTCPICAMDLVPVYKSPRGSSREQRQEERQLVNVPLYQQQLIGVQFDTVRVTEGRRSIRTVGIVAADERRLATVNLKFSGWIEKLYADYEGKSVRKGEPLFEIYSPELVSTQEEFLQSLHTMRANERVAAGNPQSGDPPHNSYVRNAEERLRLWGLGDRQISEISRRGSPQNTVKFYSSIDGFILKKNIIEGSMAKVGTDLLTIADLSTVWVYADVYEYEVAFVRNGQRARVTLSNDPSVSYSGKVDYIYPVLDKKARTAKARIVVPNRSMKLKPEMYADVDLLGEPAEDLTIAETSVLDTGTRQLVFVYHGNGRFEPREVTVGAKTGQRFIVLKGLEEGDVVVKSGNFLIDAEAHVQGVLQSM